MGKQSGFSLLELLIVCALLAIITAIAVPNISQANANYKLNAAGHSIAGLLQQTRMQAVKTNQPAYAKYDATGVVYVTGDPTASYTSGNPDVFLPTGFSFQPAPPDSSQLDAYIGATTPQVPASLGFNARGLPCSPSTNAAVCPSATTGFEWFIQDNRGAWEAVTVTPSGRIKSWRLTSMSGGKAVWQ